jgi:tRNA-dihydrouridine synthase
LKRKEITTTEIVVTIQYHLREMVSYYGEKLGVVLFRKHLKHYLAEMPEVQALLPRMLQTTSSQDLNDLIMKIADPAQVNLLLESGENDTKWITKG